MMISSGQGGRGIFDHMPSIDLTDEEHAALTTAARQVDTDRFPHSPRLAPLRSALAKLDPASAQKPLPERVPLPSASRTKVGPAR